MFNLIKKYPDLLELAQYTESQRNKSLYNIYKRDIEDCDLFFRIKGRIYPTKSESSEDTFLTHFAHLTTKEYEEEDEKGNKEIKRSFDIDRSCRLHWVKIHIEEAVKDTALEVFSYQDRQSIRTYIYNREKKYIVILEPQRKPDSYYLITAYYLNEKKSIKQIEKKCKNRLDRIY